MIKAGDQQQAVQLAETAPNLLDLRDRAGISRRGPVAEFFASSEYFARRR